MTKSELKKAIAWDLSADDDNRIIFDVSALDLTESEVKDFNGAKYVVYVEQSYITYPIPSHFEPVPAEFNDMIAGQLGI